MKRYLLFGGTVYYASGGMHDFISDHDILDEARNKGKQLIDEGYRQKVCPFGQSHVGTEIQWCHVFDSLTNSIVMQSDHKPYYSI